MSRIRNELWVVFLSSFSTFSPLIFGDPEIQCTVLLGQKIQCKVLLGRRNTVYSSTGTEKYSVQFYWDGKIQCTVPLGRIRNEHN